LGVFYRQMLPIRRVWFLALFLAAGSARADEIPPGERAVGTNRIDGEDVAVALRRLRAPAGLQVDLFAAEPDVQNPVSIAFDGAGRLYVVESHRRRTSVFDIRNHKDWLETDFSFRTVEDRANFFKFAAFPEKKPVAGATNAPPMNGLPDFNHDGVVDWRDMEVESERIQIVEDTDGSGKAGRVRTFATGFNTLVSGVAAGVLVHGRDVYFTCIPDLWRLTAPGNGGPALEREKLQTGFGVHISMGGHDMHGLIFGPDGKLYWSIADRATSTNLWPQLRKRFPGLTAETLADAGAVFRCNPDGTDFELFATGLRNPQKLAFDDEGNLFTDDNNGDGGDPARWHYVVEGADHGWRLGWQWLPRMGAWNSERLWACPPTNNAPYITPALAHIAHGPAGFCYYPGTGLPGEYDHHFFLCDFPIDVLTWESRPKGAYFEPGPVTRFLGELGPSDLNFGVDGGLYVSDWTKTYEKTGKGRIYRVHAPATDESAVTRRTKALLAGGVDGVANEELIERLGYFDSRVRQAAQFALADRCSSGLRPPGALGSRELAGALVRTAVGNPSRLARMHALWALGQACRVAPGEMAYYALELRPLAADADGEMRAQYARFLGQASSEPDRFLVALLHDSSPRARFFAAQSLGQRESKEVSGSLLELLRSNNDEDPFLRHAAVFALARIADFPALLAAAKNSSPAVRLGVLEVFRRWQRPEAAQFLADAEPTIALEAARAINDAPIPEAMPSLAGTLTNSNIAATSEAGRFILRRALNANFRLGSSENARAVASFAANEEAPTALRSEALEMIGDWPEPPARDKIVGLWRPLPKRDASLVTEAANPVAPALIRAGATEVRLAAARTAARLRLPGIDWPELAGETNAPSELRIEALKALAEANDARLEAAVKAALASDDAKLRAEAAGLSGRLGADPSALAEVLRKGGPAEKQAALASISRMNGAAADEIISGELDRLLAGTLEKEIQLDVLEAGAKRSTAPIKEKLAQYRAGLSATDPLARYRTELYGGNADEGRRTFFERQDAGCFRCHKVHGEGGAVGPELAGVGQRHPREYLLESIIYPNKEIAPGFENVVVTLKNGSSYAGVVQNENAGELVINAGEDGVVKVAAADIQERRRGLSAMPEGLAGILSARDLRNLVEFLATLN
jgi:quinoprotein glucose dehydrogenase